MKHLFIIILIYFDHILALPLKLDILIVNTILFFILLLLLLLLLLLILLLILPLLTLLLLVMLPFKVLPLLLVLTWKRRRLKWGERFGMSLSIQLLAHGYGLFFPFHTTIVPIVFHLLLTTPVLP